MRIKEAIDVHMVEYDSSEDSLKPRGIRIRALHLFELGELNFNIMIADTVALSS